MTENIIIYIALFLIYFHIGGLATTNIIRLTKGNTIHILSSKCECDNCGYKISPILQLPVISYILCKGKCKNCSSKIPVFPLVLEVSVMLGMFIISLFFKLSATGVFLSFLYYEIIRIITIFVLKKRENAFIKNYIIAVLSMIPFLLLTLIVSLIKSQI